MINVSSNASKVIDNIEKKVSTALNKQQIDELSREIAVSIAAQMRERIHERGLDANNSQIGTYTDEYMKVRTGIYPNSDKTKKGKTKNAGVYTKGKNKGQQRRKYNRTTDRKVVISLTRTFENDFTLGKSNQSPKKIPGGYGIGWKSPYNAIIAERMEKVYKKKIWATTDDEVKDALKIAKDYIAKIIDTI